MFCGGHFEFLIRARCAGAWSGIEVGTEIGCEGDTGSQNAGFVTCVQSVATWRTNGLLLMLQRFWKIIQPALWNVKESTLSRETNLK